ncbi:MAG: peptide deformylase [Candidatus Omnitrophica bacterium]|nr:peptide deformylase [Candidatus Omnitrophota bacterium]
MAVKTILSYPQASHILTAQSEALAVNESQTDEIVLDLKDTLRATPNGVGLAAPQIGYLKRIFVLNKDYISNDLAEDSLFLKTKDQMLVFINPKIITQKGEVFEEEGCLSVPGEFIKIKRAKQIKVRAYNELGMQFYEKFKGLASRAIQQEIDHLNGILILNYTQGAG